MPLYTLVFTFNILFDSWREGARKHNQTTRHIFLDINELLFSENNLYIAWKYTIYVKIMAKVYVSLITTKTIL